MDCFVYIMASRRNGTLYVGVTSDLVKRAWQHRNGEVPGFTLQYGVKDLVWYEGTASIEAAIAREKQIKNWKRQWKVALVEGMNPYWRDLYGDILGE